MSDRIMLDERQLAQTHTALRQLRQAIEHVTFRDNRNYDVYLATKHVDCTSCDVLRLRKIKEVEK